MSERKLSTTLVHAGEHERAANGFTPTSAPIHASTTFVYPGMAALDAAFEQGGDNVYYVRHGNPTVMQLETVMTAVEGGRGAVACSSGMSALYLALLAAGTPRGETAPQPRCILASHDLYGATHVLLRDFFQSQRVQIVYCDMTDVGAVRLAIDAYEPDVVLVETMSNPLLKLADIEAISGLAHAADARVVVDATMATPILQRPLQLGADVAVHSATKYLSGHADAMGGVAVAGTALVADVMRSYSHTLGMNLGVFEARLITRGIKTLQLRMRQQCANALRVAQALESHPGVGRVIYPGLASHPQHALATRMFDGGYGGMMCLELATATRARVFEFMDRLRLVLPATSLGDIYTLVVYPPLSSHRELSQEQRHAQGIGDGLIRFSIGIEDADDIIADITQALG